MKRAIVYSEKSKIIRRIIIADGAGDETALNPANYALKGEAFIFVEDDFPIDTFAAQKRVAEHNKIKQSDIPSGRCAVVDAQGIVVNVVMADPDLDEHPHGKLVHHDTAHVGQVLGAK